MLTLPARCRKSQEERSACPVVWNGTRADIVSTARPSPMRLLRSAFCGSLRVVNHGLPMYTRLTVCSSKLSGLHKETQLPLSRSGNEYYHKCLFHLLRDGPHPDTICGHMLFCLSLFTPLEKNSQKHLKRRDGPLSLPKDLSAIKDPSGASAWYRILHTRVDKGGRQKYGDQDPSSRK